MNRSKKTREHYCEKGQKNIRTTLCASIVILAGMTISTTAFAHCDGMDGPVITEAKSALQAHDVTPLLKWVPENREDTVRKAFDEAISKQGGSQAAQEKADQQRLHHSGTCSP
ncbi:DUF6448 family protein [Escherichia coli]|uniref:DUF6448 family protein n=1 Tax=Escherichia coli TaxID=562 RepID=UPI003F497E85